MRKLLLNSIILTILIVSLVIITTNNYLQNISPWVKILVFIIVGVLLVAIALMIGSIRDRKKTKSLDKTNTNKTKRDN
jgi:hypothetical protein